MAVVGLPATPVAVGSFLSPRVFRQAVAIHTTGVGQALSLSLCFGLAWLAAKASLAPIVGAFAAALVPVFFVRMGLLVHVDSFLKPGVIGFARGEAGGEPRHLRRRPVHSRGHDHGDAAPPPVVAEAGRGLTLARPGRNVAESTRT
jgi:hypothetical protein